MSRTKEKQRAGGRSKKPATSLASPDLLPICAECKRVRAYHDQWQSIEGYLFARFGLEFTHTLCPDDLAREIERTKAYDDL